MSGDLLRVVYPGVNKPLPRSWATTPGVDLSVDRLTATCSTEHRVVADYPAPVASKVYYYEVRIIAPELQKHTTVFKNKLAVGFHNASIDDWFGYEFTGRITDDVVAEFKHGDVVGCGYRFGPLRGFFTLNGCVVASKYYVPSHRLYPMMIMSSNGCDDPIGGEANFGQRPFLFDVFEPQNLSKLSSFGS